MSRRRHHQTFTTLEVTAPAVRVEESDHRTRAREGRNINIGIEFYCTWHDIFGPGKVLQSANLGVAKVFVDFEDNKTNGLILLSDKSRLDCTHITRWKSRQVGHTRRWRFDNYRSSDALESLLVEIVLPAIESHETRRLNV